MADRSAAVIVGIDVGTRRSAFALLRLHVNGHGQAVELIDCGDFDTYDIPALGRMCKRWRNSGVTEIGIERPIPAPRISRNVLISLSMAAGFLEGYLAARGFRCSSVSVTEVRRLVTTGKRGTPGDSDVKRFLREHVQGMRARRTNVHQRDAAMIAYILLKRYL